MKDDRRPAYIAGLRALADLLERHGDLPLPDGDGVKWYLFGGDLTEQEQKAEAARLVRILPGRIIKRETGDLFRFKGAFAGLDFEVIVDRPAVCERVVVRTERVTVPATPAQDAQPERVEEREIVEWRCEPLLAGEKASA